MGPYAEIRTVEKRYSSVAMTMAVSFGLILILADMKPMGKGLILGTLFSALNFILMGETITRRIAASRKGSAVRAGISLLLRYVLLAIPLILAIKFPSYHLATTIAGLFMIQILILAHHTGRAIYESKRKKLDY
jgi:hypothetical protein